jgi:hypothetical protein
MNHIFRDATEPELKMLANMIGNAVQENLPPGCGFVVLFFDDDQIGQYVCNCERPSMIKVLRETADRLDAREDITR